MGESVHYPAVRPMALFTVGCEKLLYLPLVIYLSHIHSCTHTHFLSLLMHSLTYRHTHLALRPAGSSASRYLKWRNAICVGCQIVFTTLSTSTHLFFLSSSISIYYSCGLLFPCLFISPSLSVFPPFLPASTERQA